MYTVIPEQYHGNGGFFLFKTLRKTLYICEFVTEFLCIMFRCDKSPNMLFIVIIVMFLTGKGQTNLEADCALWKSSSYVQSSCVILNQVIQFIDCSQYFRINLVSVIF